MLHILYMALTALICTLSPGLLPSPEQEAHDRLLFREALYSAYPVEIGTFQMFPCAPFGSRKPLLSRIAEIINSPEPRTNAERRRIAAIYLHFWKHFPGMLQTVRLTPGTYILPAVDRAWQRTVEETRAADKDGDTGRAAMLRKQFMANIDESFVDCQEPFEVTPLHLALATTPLLRVDVHLNYATLLRYLQADPFGVDDKQLLDLILQLDDESRKNSDDLVQYPTLAGNGKRPYGDRRYYYWDLEDAGVAGLRALGEEDPDNKRRAFSPEQEDALDRALRELPLVMQALALYGVFPGEDKE